MRWSQTPIRTLRETPLSATIKSHILLVRGGFVHQLASGLFTYSPFMVRALKKFKQIVRTEMQAHGFCEIFMPMVQPKEIWEQTKRWDSFSEILQKIKNRSGQEFCLGPTHEEVVTQYIKNAVQSYRDLPFLVYQVQTKYRDEYRPRFGLLRAREFLMKDAYSFDLNREDALKSYQKMEEAYQNIFSSLGVDFRSVQASSGEIGGDFSKEFHILADEGEDTLLISKDKAINKDLGTLQGDFEEYKGIEVGHIFYLGTKYSKAMNATYLDSNGKPQLIEMGCYGIGISRTIQAIVEQSHDDHGIIWPLSVAPFLVHLLGLNLHSSQKVKSQSEKLYAEFCQKNKDCFFDDRNEGAGVKFKDADLLGFPFRITVGEKDLAQNQVEISIRKTGEKIKVKISECFEKVNHLIKKF